MAAQEVVVCGARRGGGERGNEVVVGEGVAGTVGDFALVERVVSLYNEKYNWDVDPKQLPGPFYAVRPQVAFGWHFEESEINPESSALGNATSWRFRGIPDTTGA